MRYAYGKDSLDKEKAKYCNFSNDMRKHGQVQQNYNKCTRTEKRRQIQNLRATKGKLKSKTFNGIEVISWSSEANESFRT